MDSSGGGLPAVEAARLAAWTAPLKPAVAAAVTVAIAASPPVSVPPPRHGRRTGAHECAPSAGGLLPAIHAGPGAAAFAGAAVAPRPAAEQRAQDDGHDDAWVHVERPAAVAKPDHLTAPAAAAVSIMPVPVSDSTAAGLALPAVSPDVAAPGLVAAVAAAALALRPATMASGELLFDFDGGSQTASPARAGPAALTAAASADEVLSRCSCCSVLHAALLTFRYGRLLWQAYALHILSILRPCTLGRLIPFTTLVRNDLSSADASNVGASMNRVLVATNVC